MKEYIITELTSKNDRYAYELTQRIISESSDSDVWYELFDDFAKLLSHPRSLVRNRAFGILAANICWDDENRFDSYLDEYLSHITDEKPISARQCIKCLARIGEAKKRYIPMILTALHAADLSQYKDSMRPLIEKDIEEASQHLKKNTE